MNLKQDAETRRHGDTEREPLVSASPRLRVSASSPSSPLGPYRHLDALAGFPLLRPIRDEADLEALRQAAHADAHALVAPNFIIEKNGEISGYIALNSLPTVHGWFHTTRMRARDSLAIINVVENLIRAQRCQHLLWLLPDDATWVDHAETLGYQPMGHCSMKLKQLY